MPLIPESKVDEVRDATNLVDLISGYIPLKRSGRTYAACCPFHQEKTPSFHVWPETQTWKCFGCGKGGNVFHFLMAKEGMEFTEAVRHLAREAGVEIEPERGDGKASGDRDRLYRVMDWACRFFEKTLRSPAGEKAVEYCRSRGFLGETAKNFRLGCAPQGWRGLLEAARSRNIPEDVLEKAGLVRTGRREPYDWFRDRLMFPIQDVRGRVVGFGGRAFGDDEPKYLNSPDTALFKKGSTLYAMHLARDEILRDRRVGIVEGYTDVLMAHQHGIRWIVAGLGTGLTREHASLVKRYAERVDLIYDGDEAGRKAAERALAAFLQVEADVRVVGLPGGRDPCDFLEEEGTKGFLARIEEGREAFEFLVDVARDRNDCSTLAGRTSAVDQVLSSVADLKNEVLRDQMLVRLSEAFEVSEPALRDRIRIFRGRPEAISVSGELAGPSTAESPVERLLAEAVMFKHELALRLPAEWPVERMTHPVYRQIAATAAHLAVSEGEFDPAVLAGRLENPEAGEVAAVMLVEGREKTEFERQFDDCVRTLGREVRLREVRAELEAARQAGDEDRTRELERELFRIRSQRG